MVMHARKLPRLSDGYYDRGSAHPFEDKGPCKNRDGQYDKYGRKDNSKLDKHSPRYSSKTSYKDRIDRGNKSRSPDNDRRSNHSAHKDGALSSRHSSHTRAVASSGLPSSKDKKVDHRNEIQKFALRVCCDWSEHLSSSGKRYYYNCKTEVSKWEKPKDWSDDKAVKTEYGRKQEEASYQKKNKGGGPVDRKHSSSSGAASNNHAPRYSQSERAAADHRHQQKQSSSSGGRDSSSRGGGGGNEPYRGAGGEKYRGGGGNNSHARRKDNEAQSAMGALQNQRVLHQQQHQRASNDTSSRNSSKDRLSSSYNHSSSNSKAVPNSRDKYGRDGGRSDSGKPGNGSSGRQGSVTPGAMDRDGSGRNNYSQLNNSRHTSHTMEADIVNRQDEDMDISPGSTPTEESAVRGGISHMLPPSTNSGAPTSLEGTAAGMVNSSNAAGSNSVLAAIPHLISQMGDNSFNTCPNSQANMKVGANLSSAIQTLQKLQEVLQNQRHKQQQKIATHIQQLLTHSQMAPSSSKNSAQTNGNHVIASSGGAPVPHLSPALSNLSPSLLAQAQSLIAASSAAAHGQQQNNLLTSTVYALASSAAAASGTSVIGGGGMQTSSHHQPLRVVTENGGGGHSPGAESAGTPLGSPELNLPDDSAMNQKDTPHRHHHHDTARLNSPALSQSSSQRGGVTAALATGVTTLQRQESYKLPPSLANYFNADLISHVTGWPMQIIEKQADLIKQKSHTLGNIYSTQVSCELKKARSLVRVSEIQSTLQEQRVLFLRQQIKDLENMRSTSVSFMSPKAGR